MRRSITKNSSSITYGSDPNIVNVNNDVGNPLYVKMQPLEGADNIYINISVKGSNTGNPSQPHKIFTFSEWFPEPIIKNIGNYYLSLVSLAFSASEVPLHIINNIVTGSTQTNPNLTDWSFCFTYNNIDYQENVEYIPYNNLSVPAPPSANPPNYTQARTNYYFVENYNVFVKMFNQTLSNIYTNMFNANVVAFTGFGLTANDAPYFIYDETSEKFKLIYHNNFIGNNIDLYMSDTISVFFPGFFTYYYGTALANQKDYRFIFEASPTNQYDVNHKFNSQMYSGSPTNLNTINQIVVTSNTMRTSFEFITSDESSNNYGYSNVIFSLLPNLETPKNSKSRLVYVTNGTYRLIDIVSEGDLKQVDFNVFYSDNSGSLYPINVPKGMIANAKLIFIKKSLKKYDF